MSLKVGKARKQFKIPYPVMYAESSHKDANAFNCVQRAHQNSLENLVRLVLRRQAAAWAACHTCRHA